MLENIKSFYFYKIIFSFINEKKKLKIAKYNKKIQNKIDINLTNYKIFSDRYIVYEINGKGKEYNSYTHKLIFEGEFKNGERNGKGKEYDYLGKVEFEGEYLNGEKNGKGKEYSLDDIIFEGEYLNGEKNGKGIKYISRDKIEFEGEYKDGKKWSGKEYDLKEPVFYELKDGKGFFKQYYRDYFFEGEYYNGERNGKGKEYNYGRNVLLFEGEYLNDKRWNGKGYDLFNKNIYILKNGNGFMKEYDFEERIKFEGEYLNGERNGKGKEYDRGSLSFIGEYLNGKRNGKGKEYYYNDLIFEGEYLNGKRNGKGKGYGVLSHITYEGNYSNGKESGNGKLYNQKGELIFEGEFLYGKKIKGKAFIHGILEYEGEYLYDAKWNGKGYDKNGNIIYELKNGNGNVREYNNEGKLIYEGEYLKGRKNGKGIEYGDITGLKHEGIFENGKFIDGIISFEEYEIN